MKKKFNYFVFIVTVLTACNKNDEKIVNPKIEKKWRVTTVAGDGFGSFQDGPVLTARFRAPQDLTVTPDGVIYVADAINHRIRKIADAQVTTFAGSGLEDTTSGVGTVAGFAFPTKITQDKDGNLYTLDIEDLRVRKISSSGLVTVVAGSGEHGFADGRAETAKFGVSEGISVDSMGNIYISDNQNKRIRKISITGDVNTIAGNGKDKYVNGNADTASFFSPTGIVIDRSGNLFVADYNRVRKITPGGIVSTFAGNDTTGYKDGNADIARFTFINDIVIDDQGNIYATDDNRIRKISTDGEVSTIAGNTAGYNDGDGGSAKFNNPVGLAIDNKGNIYVADDNNNRIRKISLE
jgi:sugar lactone lactonase YvrE